MPLETVRVWGEDNPQGFPLDEIPQGWSAFTKVWVDKMKTYDYSSPRARYDREGLLRARHVFTDNLKHLQEKVGNMFERIQRYVPLQRIESGKVPYDYYV